MTPGADGRLLVGWARAAETTGRFSSLGFLERIPYESYDPFVAMGAAAAATETIGLVTMIVIGPLRPGALLAKQAASIQGLSGGRLTLGLSIGARADDYRAAGVPTRGRGRRLSEQVAFLRDAWEAGMIVPSMPHPPRILVGGLSPQAFARMARSADGYVHGGGPPRAFASAASRALAAWSDLGRPGRPPLWGQGYFALGDDEVTEAGRRYLLDYYEFTGAFAEKVAATNLTTPHAIADFVRGYEDAGCDELVLLPTVSRLDQVERLAEVLS